MLLKIFFMEIIHFHIRYNQFIQALLPSFSRTSIKRRMTDQDYTVDGPTNRRWQFEKCKMHDYYKYWKRYNWQNYKKVHENFS